MVPFILVFGIYIIFHGHVTPGGGFAGGTVITAALILSSLNGRKNCELFKVEYLSKVICISLIGYGLIKASSTFFPHEVHRLVPRGVPGNLLSGGFILPLNIIVGVSVACSLYIFFIMIGDGSSD